MNSIYLAVQDELSRLWAPVAKVTREEGLYRLVYTKGSEQIPGFAGFGRMSDLQGHYVSKELFPILKNRTLPKSRPEYADYLKWLGLSPSAPLDELDELSRSGGLRATDGIEIIPVPRKTELGNYEAYFFSRGISHLPDFDVSRIKVGANLFVMKDFQNRRDENALLLRTDDPISLVGYAPKYYSTDFSRIAGACEANELSVTVEQVNPRAPSAYRVLCKISAPWPKSFEVCTSESFSERASEGPLLFFQS